MEKNKPTSNESEDQIIQGHQYDGIQEYDNPMPGWWVWMFIGSFFFSIYYLVGMETGYINTYTDDLEENLTELEAVRANFAASQPAFLVDEATLASYATYQAKIEAGAVHFTAQCAACHGAEGQGLIGPNLTDAYWIKGGT